MPADKETKKFIFLSINQSIDNYQNFCSKEHPRKQFSEVYELEK